MQDALELFGVMMAIMLPVGIGWGIFVLISNFNKRLKGRGPSAQELDELRDRLEQLEREQAQVHELAERLDFVERMLPPLREGKQ